MDYASREPVEVSNNQCRSHFSAITRSKVHEVTESLSKCEIIDTKVPTLLRRSSRLKESRNSKKCILQRSQNTGVMGKQKGRSNWFRCLEVRVRRRKSRDSHPNETGSEIIRGCTNPSHHPSDPDGKLSVKNSGFQLKELSSRPEALEFSSAYGLYETKLFQSMSNNFNFVSTELVGRYHSLAYSALISQELAIEVSELHSLIEPAFKKFCSIVVKHNEQLLLKNINDSTHAGIKTYIFELCASQLNFQNSRCCLVPKFLQSVSKFVQQNELYCGQADPSTWISDIVSRHKVLDNFIVLEKYFRDCILSCYRGVSLFHTMCSVSLSKHISDVISEQKELLEIPEDSELRSKIKDGDGFIQEFFGHFFKITIQVEKLGTELSIIFTDYYENVLTKITKRHLSIKKDLILLDKQLQHHIIPIFESCISTLFTENLIQFFEMNDYSGKYGNMEFLLSLTHIQRNRAVWAFRYLLHDERISVANANKINIRKCYMDSLRAVQKEVEHFETAITNAEQINQLHFEFCQEQYELALKQLQRNLCGFKFPIDTCDFIARFKSHCDSFGKATLSRVVGTAPVIVPQFGLNSQIEPSISTEDRTCQTLVIDLNFCLITVATPRTSYDDTLSVHRFLPQWKVTAKDVCIGSSCDEIDHLVGQEPSVDFTLSKLLNPNSVYKKHACFIYGLLTMEVRPDKILSLFLNKLKRSVEQQLGIGWLSVLIIIPLRFTMGQRWIVKQSAEMARFDKCTLLNNTSAAAYEAAQTMELKKFERLFVAVKSEGLFDSAIYLPGDKGFGIEMYHSFPNIPEHVPNTWLNLQENRRSLNCMDWEIIECVRASLPLKSKYPLGRDIFTLVLNTTIDRKVGNVENDDQIITAILVGAAKLLTHSLIHDKPPSYFIQERTVYPVFAVMGSQKRNLLNRSTKFSNPGNAQTLSVTSDSSVALLELCNGENHILALLNITEVRNTFQFSMSLVLDRNGCLHETIRVKLAAMDKFPKISCKWEEPKFTKREMQIFLENLQKATPYTQIDPLVLKARDLATKVELKVTQIGNPVVKKFVSDALISLNLELSKQICTSNSINSQQSKLLELLKKFNVDIDYA